MAKISFDDIRNKESGKIGIVCGTGGSLADHHSKFEDLSKNHKDKYCFISCNEWNHKTKLDVDYWVVANSVFTVKTQYPAFNSKPNTILLYADSADVDSKSYEEKLTIDFIPYDERHVAGGKCIVPLACCKNIDPNRKTIHEYLKDITGGDTMYQSCGTVGIHMLAVAVILGCNPIYVSGIDMDYKTGYVDGSNDQHKHGNISEFSKEFGVQAKIIASSAEKIGIKIINLSKVAAYEGLEVGEFIESK